MRVLIVGSGGREHALAWKLRRSSGVTDLHIAPGNGGTAGEGINIPIGEGDIAGLMAYIREQKVDFVIPGPELPLVLGLADTCLEAGVPCFGPCKYAAQLEGSKAFAKELMREAGVPTADFGVFTDIAEARAYVRSRGAPIVVKADGLAAGKGVVVARDEAEAFAALDRMMAQKIFGESGGTVVVEEALSGEEVSFLCFCDGETILPLPSAQDHKAVFDGDTGPNTGGMGAYSPAPLLPEARCAEVADEVIRPMLRVLKKRGHPFSGILYAGLMLTASGLKVLEYNVRFGDPECQPLLMRFQGDLLAVMLACAKGRLDSVSFSCTDEPALCVVMAGEGYPGEYAKGMPVGGLEEAEATAPGAVKVFQAGTKMKEGSIVSSGGRILGVTALGATLREAHDRAYAAVAEIRLDKSHYRRDIGWKALKTL